MNTPPKILNRIAVVPVLAALVGIANGQISSAGGGSNQWSFSLQNGSAFQITDLGESVYNSYGTAGAYGQQTGTGKQSSSVDIDRTQGGGILSLTGTNAVSASASAGPNPGSAIASIGSMETFTVAGIPGESETPEESIFTSECLMTIPKKAHTIADSTAAFESLDELAGVAASTDPDIGFSDVMKESITSDSINGTTIGTGGGYTYVGTVGDYYEFTDSVDYLLTPGKTYTFQVYSGTTNMAYATPTPTSACTLLFGLGSFAIFRGRGKRNDLKRTSR